VIHRLEWYLRFHTERRRRRRHPRSRNRYCSVQYWVGRDKGGRQARLFEPGQCNASFTRRRRRDRYPPVGRWGTDARAPANRTGDRARCVAIL